MGCLERGMRDYDQWLMGCMLCVAGGKCTENYKCSMTGILCLLYTKYDNDDGDDDNNIQRHDNEFVCTKICIIHFTLISKNGFTLDFCVFRRNRQKSLNSFFLPSLVFSIFSILVFGIRRREVI